MGHKTSGVSRADVVEIRLGIRKGRLVISRSLVVKAGRGNENGERKGGQPCRLIAKSAKQSREWLVANASSAAGDDAPDEDAKTERGETEETWQLPDVQSVGRLRLTFLVRVCQLLQ